MPEGHFMLDHPTIRHHKRFFLAVAIAFAAWWPAAALGSEQRLIAVVDVFFAVYFSLILHLSLATDPQGLRARAKTEDEGIVLIVGVTVTAIAFSLASIFTLLNQADGAGTTGFALAIASVPLGWATLHAMLAQHYAHIYYTKAGKDGGAGEHPGDRGGLDFPGNDDPESWDFLYFSFVIGMTAQTSDVAITTRGMRRIVLAHSLASFIFNTVLVAVAVNAAVGGSH